MIIVCNGDAWSRGTFIIFTLIYCFRYTSESAVDIHGDFHMWSVKLKQDGSKTDKQMLDVKANKIALDLGAVNMGQIGELSGYYLYKTHSLDPSHVQELFDCHQHVEWYKQDTWLKRTKRGGHVQFPTFHDPLYAKQWHLKNTERGNLDCNVTGVWAYNVTGRGVVVAIVDDGVEWQHPDLLDNYCAEGSFDLNSNDDDPTPSYDKDENNKHGTRCAGEVAAVPNSVCGVGIAYGSRFSGIRVLDGPTTDSTEATAFNKHMDVNDVYSCSWGPEDDGKTVDGPHEMGQMALAHGVVAGRGGFGSVFVVASGNGGDKGDNCNYDGYANSVYTLTIGAVDEYGKKPLYAEECTSMMACTVSSGSGYARSIVTTDWSLGKHHTKDQCTRSHSGTSAATPLAAGMIALMLEVRPCLSWRDIQHIMAMTARKIDPGEHWTLNAAGFEHSNIHGYGLLDAWRLVNAARVWESVPWLTSIAADTSTDQNLEVPSGEPLILQVEISTEDCMKHLLSTLEYVVFTVTVTHPRRGMLSFVFECPSGTASIIPMRLKDDSGEGLTDWSFSSVKCWGENPSGIYTLKIYDESEHKSKLKGNVGILKEWKLTIYGSQWTMREMKERRKLVESSMHGNFLLYESNSTMKCPAGQPLDFDITTALSDRTIKLVAMLSCFFVFWGIYYSIEMAFCNAEDKAKNESVVPCANNASPNTDNPPLSSVSCEPVSYSSLQSRDQVMPMLDLPSEEQDAVQGRSHQDEPDLISTGTTETTIPPINVGTENSSDITNNIADVT